MVLVAIALISFLPGLYNGFVNFDDDTNFLANSEFQGFGWKQWRWAVSTERLGVYQPLAWILLEAEFAVSGLHPAGYHFTSIIFHAANCVLLYALTLALLARIDPRHPGRGGARAALLAGVAVALFAAHPLRVEAVAWASAQPYLPSGGFALLSVLAYLAAHPKGAKARSGFLLASIVLFTMSLACKAATVGLPLVLAILDVYPLKRLSTGRLFSRISARVAIEKIPFIVLSLAAILVAVHARDQSRSLETVPDSGLSSRLTQACYSALFYPAKTLIPSELTAYYPLPDRVDWREQRFLAAVSLAIFITTILVLWRATYPGMLAAWISYLAILGPQLGLIRTGPQLVADRYGYLAMMAWTTPVAWALIGVVAAARPRISRLALAAAVAAGLGAAVGLAFLSNRQSRIWHDSVTLWTHVQKHGGERIPVVQIHLALSLVGEGRLDEALALLSRSVELDPNKCETQNNLGWILMAKGKIAEAITRFETAIRIQPDYPEARNNWGAALALQGKHREAVAQYNVALRLFPDYFDAHRNLAASLLRLGQSDAAVDQLEAALRLRPASAEARQWLDEARRRGGGVRLSPRG